MYLSSQSLFNAFSNLSFTVRGKTSEYKPNKYLDFVVRCYCFRKGGLTELIVFSFSTFGIKDIPTKPLYCYMWADLKQSLIYSCVVEFWNILGLLKIFMVAN